MTNPQKSNKIVLQLKIVECIVINDILQLQYHVTIENFNTTHVHMHNDK